MKNERHDASPLRKRIAPAGLALVVAVLIAGLAILGGPTSSGSPGAASAPSTDHFNGVDQNLLHSCEAAGKDCTGLVPGLTECMAKYDTCDAAARSRDTASWASAYPGKSPTPASDLKKLALSKSDDPSKATIDWVKQYTQGSLLAAGENAEPWAPDDTAITVIAVIGPITVDGGVSGITAHEMHYALILDTATGRLLSMCEGDYCGLG